MRQTAQSQRLFESNQRGATLIEVLVATTVLMLALLAFTRVIVSSLSATDSQHEASVARSAAQQMIERLQATEFESVFALYNEFPDDDPDGPGTAFGKNFQVSELSARSGDADGLVGEVLFPISLDSNGLLDELHRGPYFGTPRDLNGDGLVDGLLPAGEYKLLPVLVRLEWRGTSGPSKLELRTLLADY